MCIKIFKKNPDIEFPLEISLAVKGPVKSIKEGRQETGI